MTPSAPEVRVRRLALVALFLAAAPASAAPMPWTILPSFDVAPPAATLDAVRTEARAAWRAGDADGAATLARSYLRDAPPVPRGVHDLVLLQSAHFGGADATAHGALPADTETIDGLVELGWFLQRAGDHRATIDLLEAVLARCPDQAEAHLIVSESRDALGHHDDAQRHAERYLELTTVIPQS